MRLQPGKHFRVLARLVVHEFHADDVYARFCRKHVVEISLDERTPSEPVR